MRKTKILCSVAFYCLVVFLLTTNTVIAESGSHELRNPLAFNSLIEFLRTILVIARIFLIPIVIFFIIYSGFLFVVGRGNPETLSRAKYAFLASIVGGLIILGVEVIINIIENLVTPFGPDE